ncbi:MAG: GGDEF domain-containing protein [Deltaproteobacteria bacterium]|nr:GGDEF domain-containing protein [Deltaproteobacteria bacterium]
MAFWRSARKEMAELPAASPEEGPAADPTLGPILDLAAGILKDYGRMALDVEGLAAETLRSWCDHWAQHLLIGAPRPGDPPAPTPIERRDWSGARRFFSERRREEIAFVSRSLTTLQKAIWSFIQTLDGLLVVGDDSDQKLRTELNRLKTVAQGGSAELLRQEVVGTVEEIGRLAQARTRALRERVDGLAGQVRTLHGELEIARQESTTDGLTRVFNRKALDERIDQAASMGRLFGQVSSLLLLDVDHFKLINDTYGHVAGDAVLRELADGLVRAFPVKSELVARFGGEEFAVVLWDTPLAKARVAAERALNTLRSAKILHEGKLVPVTVSVGVAQLRPGEDARPWLERADRALYAAKHEGRNRIACEPG